jgi:hypothetical protein
VQPVKCHGLAACLCDDVTTAPGTFAAAGCRSVLYLPGSFIEVEDTLRLTFSQSICLGIEYPCGTCDQILFPVGMLLSEVYGLVSMYWAPSRHVSCTWDLTILFVTHRKHCVFLGFNN